MAAHYWFFSDDSSFFLPFSNVRCENEGEGCSSVFLKLQWNKKITWNINSLFTVSSIIIIIIIIDELMFFPPHFLLFSLIILQICMCFEFFPSYLKKKKKKMKRFHNSPSVTHCCYLKAFSRCRSFKCFLEYLYNDNSASQSFSSLDSVAFNYASNSSFLHFHV